MPTLLVISASGLWVLYGGLKILVPVKGTHVTGLQKTNTMGLAQANKAMHLSVIAYNLKKYLKFDQKSIKSGAGTLALTGFVKKVALRLFSALPRHRKLTFQY